MSPFLRHRGLALATAVFLLATAVAAGLLFAGSHLLEDRRVLGPLLLVLGVTGFGALLGWATERARGDELAAGHRDELARLEAERALERQDAESAAERLRAELDAARAGFEADRAARAGVEEELQVRVEGLERALAEEAARYEERLDEANEAVRAERRLQARREEARLAERRFGLELRRQLAAAVAERGTVGDSRAVRELLLRTAMGLLGAAKGVLLRRGGEGNGLVLLAQEGFSADPAASVLVGRTARTALEGSAPVREEDEARLAASRGGAADTEIENLLAVPFGLEGRAGVVVLANRAGGFDDHPDDVLLALGTALAGVLEDARLREELRTAFLAALAVLADALAARDRTVLTSSADGATYAAAVAHRLGLEPRRRDELVLAALLHDVGKAAIGEAILAKPGPLTGEERGVVQLHPRIGALLVRQVPGLGALEPAILHHHERWDGTGYPDGLAGEAIPVESRILAATDAFASMTADRPYRARMSAESACAELERCAGSQFDPVCARLLVEEVRRRPPSPERPDALRRALAELDAAARQGAEQSRFVGIRGGAPAPPDPGASWN